MTPPTVYVVGAGLSGLSAAVALAAQDIRVIVLEGAGQAGGRCRSYFDSTLNAVIDNGNHLVLSGNRAVFDYVRTIGSESHLVGPDRAHFDFVDIENDARWSIAPNDGPLAWWVAAKSRRVPGTAMADYLDMMKLLAPKKDARVCDTIRCDGPLWRNLMHPFLLAALNTEPETASAALAGAIVRETLAKGGRAYRPRIAEPNLAATFIDPALKFLESKGCEVRFNQRVRGLVRSERRRVIALAVGSSTVPLAAQDRVIVAVPPWAAEDLVPHIAAPNDFRAIVNAHFRVAPPPDAPSMLGVIGGTAEWIFAFADRISVTISGADRLVDTDRGALARLIWADVCKALDLHDDLPPWQIVKEKRATFAATPQQAARRPKAQTDVDNLFLAGDWTDTGLPATIEGAIRSGHRAAKLARVLPPL